MRIDTEQLIADAWALVRARVPFLHQGRDPAVGLDCLGLLEHLAHKQGYMTDVSFRNYPHTPNGRAMYRKLKTYLDEIPRESARRGDVYQLKFRQNPQHLALRVSDDDPPMVIHAENRTHRRVVAQPLNDEMVLSIHAAFRLRQEDAF
jgi:hypothetical protein